MAHITKGEATRQRILEQAAPLFNQRGYEACSLQELMDATGLEKGGIYRHFGSKEELAAESFRYALGLVREARTANFGDSADPLQRLRHMVDGFVDTPSPLPGGCPLMNAAIDNDDGNPVLRKLAADGLRDWKQRIAATVEQGQHSGHIRMGADPQAVANLLVATLEGALMLSRMERRRDPLLDARSALHEFLQGLAPPRIRRKR